MEKRKIPDFKSKKEMADFWDKHSPLDYKFEKEEIVDPKKKRVNIWLNVEFVNFAKKIANSRGMKYQTLIRSWVAEKYLQEKALSSKK